MDTHRDVGGDDPAVVIPAEDSWAYTSEHIERVRQALTEVQAGELLRLSGDDLLQPPS